MKKSQKKNKYFVYAFAYDLDETMPPFSGRVSYAEYEDLEDAKRAIMQTELSRFAGFEIISLQVKGPKNKLEDAEDNLYHITIDQTRTPEHKAKLQAYFQSLAEDQVKQEQEQKTKQPKRPKGCCK